MSVFEEVGHLFEQAANSGTLGALLVAVCGVLILIVLYMIGMMIFEKIDKDKGTTESGTGQVVELSYTHAYSTTTSVANVPVPQYSPESWKLTLNIEGKLATIEVAENVYNQTRLGDRLQATYIRGRFTGNLYLTEVFSSSNL